MESIINRLQTDCPFPWIFEDIEDGSPSWAPEYKSRMGHYRADHDGYRWWYTWWPAHEGLHTPERAKELHDVYTALIDKSAFSGLNSLRRFCDAHPEALVNPACPDEYNFYYEGKLCYFWIRAITRKGDYNLYINAFCKGV